MTKRYLAGTYAHTNNPIPVCFAKGECWLQCPCCSDINLHQLAVEVGFRKKEDEPESDIHTISMKGLKTERGSIAGRRDAMHIKFQCEAVGTISILTIAQHKGLTVMYWEKPGVEIMKKRGTK